MDDSPKIKEVPRALLQSAQVAVEHALAGHHEISSIIILVDGTAAGFASNISNPGKVAKVLLDLAPHIEKLSKSPN